MMLNVYNIETKKKYVEKKIIYVKKKNINIFMINKNYFIHTGIRFHKTKFKFIDIGSTITKYCFTKKPFSSSVNKILKKM